MKFNLNKSQLNQNKVCYMGHLFSAIEMCPDPAKVTAIVNMSKPEQG